MCFVFLSSEDSDQHIFGHATLACITVCIFLQCLTVFTQCKNFPLSRKVLELLYVTTFLKPAIYANRVVIGMTQTKTKGGEELIFTPLTELMLLSSSRRNPG